MVLLERIFYLIMINIIACLCSLCINFCAFNIQPYNALNYTIVDSVRTILQNGNAWQQSYSLVESEHYFVLDMANGTYKLFIPRELPEPNYSSSLTVNDSNGHYISTTLYNYVEMTYNPNSNTVSYEWPSSRNFTFYYPDEVLTPTIIYCGSDNFYYNGDYLITLSSEPVLGLEGHSSGWSDLIEEVDGHNYTVLGHSNNGINNSNSFDLVTVQSGLSDKLLAAIGRLLAGINDSLSYGQGTLIGVGSLILTHVVDIKNWLFEPVDPDLLQERWGHSSLGTLVDTINIDFNGHAYDPDDLVIRWNLSSIPYFHGCVGSFDLSAALDPSKYIWQPLLIMLLYASLVWGFIRSIPNIIGGVSPISNNHIQAPKDTPKTSKGG